MDAVDGFAVVDLETTGLFPGGSDRILEVAVIRYNAYGQLIDEYTTLVNPERDVGATHVHGITAKDVIRAPLFGDIAGDVAKICRDAVFVAHDASFDRRFLSAEFARLGHPLPSIPCLCTMRLAGLADPSIPGRKLETLCSHFGISLHDAHSAYWDAVATADLFSLCVDRLGGWRALDLPSLCIAPRAVRNCEWPDLQPMGLSLTRDEVGAYGREEESYLTQLVSRLPRDTGRSTSCEEYMALLDRVLEDRCIQAEETKELETHAAELGLTQEQARSVHRSYLQALLEVALRDGVISASEARDLDTVRHMIGISPTEFESMRDAASGAHRDTISSVPSESLRGKSVCFTGAFRCCLDGRPISRKTAIEAAENAGMTVLKSVTKCLDFLVVADPHSQSGKARKARQYGTRMLSESVFWNMLGMDVE